MEKEKHPKKQQNQSETICATMNEKNESEDMIENELLSIKIHSSLSSNENEHLNELNDADEATMDLPIGACIPKDLNPDQQRVWQQLAWQQMPDFDPFDEEHEKLCLKQHNGRKLSAQSREIWNNWAASKRRSKQNLSASTRFRGMDEVFNATTTISSLEQNPANYSFYGIGRKLWEKKNGLLFGAAALTFGGMVYYGNNLLSENPIDDFNQRKMNAEKPRPQPVETSTGSEDEAEEPNQIRHIPIAEEDRNNEYAAELAVQPPILRSDAYEKMSRIHCELEEISTVMKEKPYWYKDQKMWVRLWSSIIPMKREYGRLNVKMLPMDIKGYESAVEALYQEVKELYDGFMYMPPPPDEDEDDNVMQQ